MSAENANASRSDLDSLDQEIAELWSGVEQLQAHVARNRDAGRPTAHLLDVLDVARNMLHERLRRRTDMFIALVMGDEPISESNCSSAGKGASERTFEHRWREGLRTRGADAASGRQGGQ